MPRSLLLEQFAAARERHAAAVDELVPLLIEMAIATLDDVVPGADVLETEGEMNEDWAFTLRIRRVLDASGSVLYDVDVGDDDPEVETRIDEVGVGYLDPLLDLTGDDYLGRSTITRFAGTR